MRTQGRLTTHFGYEALGRRSWQSTDVPDVIQDLTGPGNGQLWRTYGYNLAGELTLLRDGLRGQMHYRYDLDGQLLPRHTGVGAEHFGWDDAGNFLDHMGAHSVGAIRNNCLMVWQDVRYSYDAFGNVRTKKKGRWKEQHFVYDAEDRLIEARGHHRHGEFVTRFAYDALGRRIAKTVIPTHDLAQQWQETRFVWQGLRLAQEIDEGVVSSYVYDTEGAANRKIDLEIRQAGGKATEKILLFFK